MEIEEKILDLLKRESGLKARDIGTRFGIDKSTANSALYRLKAKRLAWQNSGYRWYPSDKKQEQTQALQESANTQLTKLCRYYLHCLSLDDESGVSLFAQSKYAPDYIELPVLPDFDPEDRPISSFAGASELFRRLRNGVNRQVPYLGYPVRVRFHKGEKWEGYFLEPVFLFEFTDDAAQPGSEPGLSGELPVFNFKVLRSFAMGDASHIMDEAARLADELGFSETEPPEMDDVMARLVGMREDWDWKEEINPSKLSEGVPLSEITGAGIYNRAIIFGCERSPYTKGLEQELGKLQSVPEDKFSNTALGAWIKRDFSAFRSPVLNNADLLEPLPLNSEQREAVENALTRPLTVITGPPGTGKSQVVSSLLINAAKRGLRVLFVSKNNKAVDVVETRVNGLGPRPVLLRLGRGEYQNNLSSYLTSLLASRATPEDSENYREAEHEYGQLTARMRELQQKCQDIIALRNEVDKAEQKVEAIRTELGQEWFEHFCGLNADELLRSASGLQGAARQATREKQGFITRLFWFAARDARMALLRNAAQTAHPVLSTAGVSIPTEARQDQDVLPWIMAADHLFLRAEQVRAVSKYYSQLKSLTEGERLEDLTRDLARLTTESAKKSMRVWETWLRMAPARLTAEDRRILGDFNTVLRLLSQSDEQNRSAGKDVFAKYYRIFPKLISQLPCWAVTSLSARGRIPLEPGFFDLLVVDEASQCDIASLVPLLYRAKAVAVIGDPMQLRHISAISPRRDRDLLQQHNLADTHISWAFSENSVYDLASPLADSNDIVQLRDHHRSHADIIEFSNQQFYGGNLRVATNYDRLKRLHPDGPAVRWNHVQGKVVKPGTGGALNEVEAQATVREIERMVLQQGYRGSIGVVTPFRAQANRIRDILHAHPHSHLLFAQGELLVDTVHRFQGDERDVMLFSTVVSNGIAEGALGFLRKTGYLFNVAITRARAALVVVGDSAAAKNSKISYLSEFAAYVENLAQNSEKIDGFKDELFEAGCDYPTVARPELVSDWERLFYRELCRAGLRPIPQYDVEKYTLDFAIISGNHRLDIEVDGERYHRDWNGELLRRDQLRNMRMIELGWDVIRFWVYELRDKMPDCISRVKNWEKTNI